MVTGKEYAAKALEIYAIKPHPGYIYGTSGETWTETKQKNLSKKYKDDPIKYSDYKLGATYGSKWIGHRVWDCSGLTSDCGKKVGLIFYHGSNSSWNKDCAYKGKKVKGMKLPVGAWVYTGDENKHNHIGIVIDDYYVIEAEGTINGIVKSKISASKWTYWGLGKGIEFDFIPDNAIKTKEKTISTSHPTIKRGSRGDAVKELQTILRKDGSNIAVDGIFGLGTLSAVRAFQKRHDLVVDGIVGPKTWGALLKIS